MEFFLGLFLLHSMDIPTEIHLQLKGVSYLLSRPHNLGFGSPVRISTGLFLTRFLVECKGKGFPRIPWSVKPGERERFE